MNQPLANMLRYNKWATATLLEASRALPDKVLDARPPGLSGSIRVLLLHIVGSQETFVLRNEGKQHLGELTRGSGWPGWGELIRLADESSDKLIAIAEAMDADSEVDLPYMDKAFRFPRSFFLAHAVEHGVEHRTEVKVRLSQLGIDTPDLDGWQFASAMSWGQEVASSKT